MKVKVENETYLVHWKIRQYNRKLGQHTDIDLRATDCIIRKVLSDESLVEISVGSVGRAVGDTNNEVTARRLSFLKAIEGLRRPLRKALGHEYNRTCRVIPRTPGQKNRQLRSQVKALRVRIAELESAAKTEEAVA